MIKRTRSVLFWWYHTDGNHQVFNRISPMKQDARQQTDRVPRAIESTRVNPYEPPEKGEPIVTSSIEKWWAENRTEILVYLVLLALVFGVLAPLAMVMYPKYF